VGFPGETEADFERTLEVTAEAAYDSAYTFIFSPREGTEAARFTDRFVPHATCVERFERLRHVVERSALRHNPPRLRRDEEGVVEGPSKPDAAVRTGRTRQTRLVHLPVSQPLRAGTLATATVTDAAAHHLRGELREVLATPRHRTRIPVVAG